MDAGLSWQRCDAKHALTAQGAVSAFRGSKPLERNVAPKSAPPVTGPEAQKPRIERYQGKVAAPVSYFAGRAGFRDAPCCQS
jgi:hypothetical protein